MASLRKRAALVAAGIVLVLSVLGTLLWILAILRTDPPMPPARVVATRYAGRTLDVAVSGEDGFDRLGLLVRSFGTAVANGQPIAPGPVDAIVVRAQQPALKLVFDPGILAAGAASAQTPDHLLGLAGAGSVWPAPAQAAAYCGRMYTQRGDFCRHVTGR